LEQRCRSGLQPCAKIPSTPSLKNYPGSNPKGPSETFKKAHARHCNKELQRQAVERAPHRASRVAMRGGVRAPQGQNRKSTNDTARHI